ncbi:multidrug effflux MFS transporter [Shewanella atlantica]|uniref:MFS transporter n=1 Tax=Shewanella atlantica TaxID=271099 RepID=A0A3S0K042_9GAMM|nr:multidrug effflux MFS transporter [Shewanella atlantica]RTR32760.1 MFS transporter [Shewanella atlantica]
MKKLPPIWLMVTLLMFPQIVETIYSPVLPHISKAFAVNMQTASQTLSVYFIAFALGVVFWGRLCDILGRRRAMLYGLLTYGIGALTAIITKHFELLLLGRIISAFGAAVGSVVTQTMLRDSYQPAELGKVFSLMGMGISISPVIGLLAGGVIAQSLGHTGVFSVLLLLAVVLLLISVKALPETQVKTDKRVELWPLAKRMLRDRKIWRSAALVAQFNLMLFSYYALAPFIFAGLNLSSIEFGYSGVVLALGSLMGSLLNKQLLSRGWQAMTLINLASAMALFGGVGVWLLQSSLAFLLPMVCVVMAFGIAIPNILSQALVDYKQVAGSAGALFGLAYYLMLGAGLALAGLLHNLGQVLLLAAGLSGVLCLLNIRSETPALSTRGA